jgi:hypothetical protein
MRPRPQQRGWFAVALLTVALLVLATAACRSPLLSDLDEPEANEAVAVLAAAGVEAQRDRKGRRHRVLVNSADLPQAWNALQAAAALKPTPKTPAPRRWVLSPTEARLAARQRQAEDLEALLRSVPGVVEARVTLAAESAAVVLRHGDSPPPQAELEALVRQGAGLAADGAITLSLHPARGAATSPGLSSPPQNRGGPIRRLFGALLALASAAGLAWLLNRRRRRLQPPAVPSP